MVADRFGSGTVDNREICTSPHQIAVIAVDIIRSYQSIIDRLAKLKVAQQIARD